MVYKHINIYGWVLLFVVVVVVIFIEFTAHRNPEIKNINSQWVTPLVIVEERSTGSNLTYGLQISPDILIGLRSDGTVVWRKK